MKWCKKCKKLIHDDVCSVCHTKAQKDIPTVAYWCEHCRVPIIKVMDDPNLDLCPSCKNKTKQLSSDLRPVFPEERLLIELLLGTPFAWKDKSVWANNNRYYVDGKTITIPNALFLQADAAKIIQELEVCKRENSYEFFDANILTFIKVNAQRYAFIKDEAYEFIADAVKSYATNEIVLSFSGGKDSTVTADLVARALGNPYLVHIFGDTTLEFPLTIEYAQRYRKNNPKCIFKVAKNKEQVFYDVCKDIGPPARMMRWCCSMFKTGPITRILNNLYKNKQILTFYGIRKCESVNRSKYDRTTQETEAVKIQKQTVASPIFYWSDMELWLYILSDNIDFNDAYRLGYDRVGCWCCPNNNERAQFLAKIYMPSEYKKWHDFLVNFAISIGKQDPEVYIDTGKWKARQGGNGLSAADDVKIKFTNCTAEEHAKIYQLNKPITDEFFSLFYPFGKVSKEFGRKLIGEVIVLDIKRNVPILAIQPFKQEGYDYSVKIKTMNVVDHEKLQRIASYQVRKYNACRKCLKCESLCKTGAIMIYGDTYKIVGEKCVHCKKCVSTKYLDGGCKMSDYLATKE